MSEDKLKSVTGMLRAGKKGESDAGVSVGGILGIKSHLPSHKAELITDEGGTDSKVRITGKTLGDVRKKEKEVRKGGYIFASDILNAPAARRADKRNKKKTKQLRQLLKSLDKIGKKPE